MSENQPQTESSDHEVKVETTMHDKCKNVVIFHNNLSKFLKSLKGVLPECSDSIRDCIKYYKSIERAAYLEECEALLRPHIKVISQYDEGLFTDDYASGPRYLLPHLDFRPIWDLLEGDDFNDDSALQASTKKAIFNHLQTLYVSVQMALNQINVFNKNMEKQKQFLMDMMENLQMDEKLKARIEEMKREEEEAAKNGNKGGMFSIGKLADMFGEDNFVYQLAKDVAQELDMGTDDINNPVEAITQLFADNGRKLQELIVTVGDKIEQKMKSGEIDKEKLVKDAQAMKDKLEGFMGKIPGLEEMMNNNGMVQKFSELYDELDEDEKQHFDFVPDMLKQNLLEWSDEDKARFDEYAAYVMNKNNPEEEEAKTQAKTSKASKAKATKTQAPAQARIRRKK